MKRYRLLLFAVFLGILILGLALAEYTIVYTKAVFLCLACIGIQ